MNRINPKNRVLFVRSTVKSIFFCIFNISVAIALILQGCNLWFIMIERSWEELAIDHQIIDLVWEISSDGLLLIDSKGIVLKVNSTYLQMLGLTFDSVIGEPFTLAFPEREREPILNIYLRHIAEFQVPENARRNIIQSGGSSTQVEVVSRLLYSNTGEVQMLSVFRHIQDEEKPTSYYNENELRFSFILNALNDAIWDYQPLKNNMYWSPRFYHMLGYCPGEINPSIESWGKLLHPEDYVKAFQLFQKCINNETDEYIHEMRFCKKNGEFIWLQARGKVLLRDGSGKIIRMVGTHTDISDRKKWEQELIKAKERAEESDRLKTSFLANMSHEIRTPMNGIIGFSGMLIDPELPEDKKRQFIDIIINSSNQLLELINNIIDLSKAEAGQLGIINKEIVLNDKLEELLINFMPTAHAKGLGFTVKCELERNDSKIIVDDVKLKQVLQNLLSNAIKFTFEGFVEFGYTIENGEIQFYVKDTGIGIDPELHRSVFERFRQVEESNTRRYGGTGLGLSISKSLVELMGGRIWVDSALKKGSIFYFALPFHPVSPKKISGMNDNLIYPDWSNETILIAEDEEVNFFYLSEVLAPTNVRVIRAASGREAIDAARKNDSLWLILMDIKMPDIDGFEATRIIKTEKPALPIIAQTAYAMTGDRENALSAGCDDYIPKPVKRETLITILQKYTR